MNHETKATSLHDKIMRMPHGTNEAVYSERSDWLAYKTGHRDARHAAAELAAEYEAGVAQLVEALGYAIEDYAHIIDRHVEEFGENYKPARLKYMRDQLAKARAALLSHKGER